MKDVRDKRKSFDCREILENKNINMNYTLENDLSKGSSEITPGSKSTHKLEKNKRNQSKMNASYY